MHSFEKKIYDYILREQLLPRGSHVVLGLSGGADSVCLLQVLTVLKESLALTLTAVHVHHGIRGGEADGDAAFAEAFCRERGVACRTFYADVPAIAAEGGFSEEEAGRRVRYDYFRQVRDAVGADVIATAHHRDDQTETVLLNLCRGSSLRGLTGMRPAGHGIIRPLLSVTRAEIEDYLKTQGLSWREDRTNHEMAYTRNRMRGRVLPMLREEINGGTDLHVARTADLLTDVMDYIDGMAGEAARRVLDETGLDEGYLILREEAFGGLHKVLQREVIRLAFETLSGSAKDLTMTHIEQIRLLCEKPVGKRLTLPYDLRAVKGEGEILLGRAGSPALRQDEMPQGQPFEQPPELVLLEVSVPEAVRPALLKDDKAFQNPENPYTKWIDYDTIKDRLIFRKRREGDYMVIAGGRRKKLRRILIDDKISARRRDALWLLCDGDHVIWIPETGRLSEAVKVTESSRHIVQIGIRA